MNRQSVASARASILKGSSSSSQSSSAAARLLEQKKEYEALEILERLSQSFVRRIEQLCEDSEVMADAAVVQGRVLAQWPEAFRLLNMFEMMQSSSAQETGDESPAPKGERLVRVPLDEL
ncbi:hypothetical protein PENSPDRAFT_584828 [Peniophora sp. CONT]|nr:hypothetical protein PENSPDRAFT_584828 [Peniophora sp. CONT]